MQSVYRRTRESRKLTSRSGAEELCKVHASSYAKCASGITENARHVGGRLAVSTATRSSCPFHSLFVVDGAAFSVQRECLLQLRACAGWEHCPGYIPSGQRVSYFAK